MAAGDVVDAGDRVGMSSWCREELGSLVGSLVCVSTLFAMLRVSIFSSASLALLLYVLNPIFQFAFLSFPFRSSIFCIFSMSE